jgi:DNA-binding MarR family transcriptional regulator
MASSQQACFNNKLQSAATKTKPPLLKQRAVVQIKILKEIMQEASTIRNPQIVPFSVQIPSELLRYVRSRRLTGTEYSLWLYLYELAPSQNATEIPPPDAIAKEIGVDPRTIQRAAQRLADLGLFSFEIKAWKASNLNPFSHLVLPGEQFVPQPSPSQDYSPPNPVLNYSLDNEIHLPTERSRCPDNIADPPLPSPSETQAIQGFSTAEVVPEQICFKNLNQETDLGTSVLLNPDTDQEEIGTIFDRVTRFLSESGFQVNHAIRATLTKLSEQMEPKAFIGRVNNAVSAVQEQIQRGNLRKPTPEPLLNAALQGRFTSNSAKRKVRLKRKEAQAEQRSEEVSVPPPVLRVPKFDELAVSQLVGEMVFRGDRHQALGELQQWWAEGLRDDVINLLQLRRDWGFVIGEAGPQERS